MPGNQLRLQLCMPSATAKGHDGRVLAPAVYHVCT